MLLPPEGGELRAAVEAQSPPPEQLLAQGGDLHAALEAGLAGETDWLWLLDGSAVPEPNALGALIDALARLGPAPAPALLASRVVGPDGELDRASLPVPEVRDPELAVAAFGRRLLAVRLVQGGSLLLRRDALERSAPPRAGVRRIRDDLAWSARLLRRQPGLLVPDSVAVGRAVAEPARAQAGRLLRLLLSDGLATREKLYFVVRLVESVVRPAARAESPARSPGAGA